MAIKTTFLQTYTNKRKRLVPCARELAQTEFGALKTAKAITGRMPGAAARKVMAYDETGELERVAILGQLGEIPENFVERLEAV